VLNFFIDDGHDPVLFPEEVVEEARRISVQKLAVPIVN
jgi:hypothetical protein